MKTTTRIQRKITDLIVSNVQLAAANSQFIRDAN